MSKHKPGTRLTLTTTAYGPPWDSMEGGGTTSTGLKLHPGKQALVVAVDPTQIPYGTKLKIPGNIFGDDNLIFTAGDTGGAFGRGSGKLDFFVAGKGNETNHDRLNAWGVKKLTAIVVGHGSPTDVGYLNHPSAYTGSRHGQAFGAISAATGAAKTPNAPTPARTISLDNGTTDKLDTAAYEAAKRKSIVGQLFAKHEGTNGVLFKTGVLTTDAPDPADFTKAVANKPTKITIPGTPSSLTSTDHIAAANGGHGQLARLIGRMDKIDSKHLPYSWGGGHNGGKVDWHHPIPVDCSGAVSEALGIRTRVSGELANWGLPGSGRKVRIYANDVHTFMAVKRHGEWMMWGTSQTNPGGGAGWVPASAYSKAYLAGFTIRHPKGL